MRALLSFQVSKTVEGTFAHTKLISRPFAIKGNYEGPPTKCPNPTIPLFSLNPSSPLCVVAIYGCRRSIQPRTEEIELE